MYDLNLGKCSPKARGIFVVSKNLVKGNKRPMGEFFANLVTLLPLLHQKFNIFSFPLQGLLQLQRRTVQQSSGGLQHARKNSGQFYNLSFKCFLTLIYCSMQRRSFPQLLRSVRFAFNSSQEPLIIGSNPSRFYGICTLQCYYLYVT
jgi:hypothetical protein